MKNKKSFTLLELIVVTIIIGILATVSVNYYSIYRERALDDEARANIRLIAAAERIRLMEQNNCYAPVGPAPNTNLLLNQNLGLALPVPGNWAYTTTNIPPGSTNCCVQAQRWTGNQRTWRMRIGIENDPVGTGVDFTFVCP